MFYTTTRLLPPATAFILWGYLRNGTVLDPANLLLLFAIVSGMVGWTSVRRYWVIRNSSRSRKDSSLFLR